MKDHRPPPEVLRAFGATAEPVRLSGGKGGTWRAGDVVVKPAEGDDEVRWRGEVLDALPESPLFRIARPIRAANGDWVAGGWEATRAVAGQPDQQRVDDVIRTGSAFHEAVAHLPRPGFLRTRTDPWAYGERLAFGDSPAPGEPPGTSTDPGGPLGFSAHLGEPLLARLLAVRRPIDLAEQVVHGDLLGNVLFADGLPPAVIDWAAYWRPPGWATAVAVVDAMVWHGADLTTAQRWSHLPEWGQLLVRATIFRLATWAAAGWTHEPREAYEPVVHEVIAYAAHTV
ncbi:TIGR02569 family protein [Actinoplanes sp. NPDC051859]|uniref:TIGR02569 family protein n=1 Tax=Actinoplanes sp. NPDC051859 TaxID=3363909 RepID=UPI0037AD9254